MYARELRGKNSNMFQLSKQIKVKDYNSRLKQEIDDRMLKNWLRAGLAFRKVGISIFCD